MSGFNFNIEGELKAARPKPRPGGGAAKPAAKPAETQAEPRKVIKAVESQPIAQPPVAQVSQPEPEGFGVSQSHQETNSGPPPQKRVDPVNWKGFKTLKGVFQYVGGERPVILDEPIRRSQVSGLPDPVMLALQDRLKEKYTGAIVSFPWGDYTIDDRNRVFTAKPSLLRFLLFEGFRDGEGIQEQYARQWLVSYHPGVFEPNFSPKNLKPASDELDIYALIVVSHLSDAAVSEPSPREENFSAIEKIDLLSDNLMRVLAKLNDQSDAFDAYRERNDTLQTVVLLDRMGLLRGGLPKDVGSFMRVLEENRAEIEGMSGTVDEHVTAEKERRRTMERERRLREYARSKQ